jgi:hypothetical protein
MGNPPLPTLAEGLDRVASRGPRDADWHERSALDNLPSATNRSARLELLVASFGDPEAADYVAYASRRAGGEMRLAECRLDGETGTVGAMAVGSAVAQAASGVRAVILFLRPKLSERDRRALDDFLGRAGEWGTEFVGVVSSFRIHLGDQDAAEAEVHVLGRTKGLRARTVVFRPGFVLSRSSQARARLRQFGFLYPLVPRRLRGCCLDGDELFAAIEAERLAATDGPRSGRLRTYTLLGPNRPWRDVLKQHRAPGPVRACLTAASALLALLLVGQLAALLLAYLARRRPALRGWNFDTLRPRSLDELLALYNPYNYRRVKVVGYNNGVVHFGHRYPGKTVVSTVLCNRVAYAGPDILKADCGTTVRRALDFLAQRGLELPVVPNYSYVCLGTAFFVPIHGSASDFSTVADTITRVVLYDPVGDRLIAADRDETAFREHVFDLQADVLLLRLYLRVKPRSRYYIRRETRTDPGSAELLEALSDGRAANVEIRKASASADKVTVSRYYTDPGQTPSPVLELPRDALGRLWDRLEENPVTSFVMHALTRHFAWHVELFFTAKEFATFWEGHRALPLRKLQFRYIRRDGMPHSPFREHDCVSVDLFMLRRHRRRFEAYLKRTFPIVRTNPGKHSR